jgi:hypothetical protein
VSSETKIKGLLHKSSFLKVWNYLPHDGVTELDVTNVLVVKAVLQETLE